MTRHSPILTRRHRPEGGIGLILTLLVLTIVIVLVSQFAYSVKIDMRTAKNGEEDLQVHFRTVAAIPYIKAVLRADMAEGPADSYQDIWTKDEYAGFDLGGTRVECPLVDADRKMNINALAVKERTATHRRILQGIIDRMASGSQTEMPEALAQRIADYIDPDDKGDYEQGAQNGPIEKLEDLLAVEGMTETLLYGTTDVDGNSIPGLRDFLTTWGTDGININTAPLEVIYGIIPKKNQKGEEIDREQALESFADYRGDTARETGETGGDAFASEGQEGEEPGTVFEKVEDLEKVPGLANIFPKKKDEDGEGNESDDSDSDDTDDASDSDSSDDEDEDENEDGQSDDEKTKPRPLQEELSVTSRYFESEIQASGEVLEKRVRVVVRRRKKGLGAEVMIWQEISE